jgi:hypothetical protein
MRKSEIFESFVKIAQERGLVSQAEKPEHTETDFSETNPRFDSLTIEQISKLYNTKPEQPKDMEYKRNIIEDAHPDPVVISPSYDKLNGLVENENEGQNIRIRIVMKTPDGHLINRKYARKNLLLSLVRVGNELDARNNDELRKLADACLEQMSQKKSLEKTAWVQIAVIAVAVVIGAVYAKQHLRFHSDGWQADYGKAMAEIDDLLNSNTNFEVGYSYTPAFIQTLNQLKTELNKLNSAVMKAIPILDKMQTPKNAEELKKMIDEPETKDAVKAVQDLQAQMTSSYPFINTVINSFGNEAYKQRAIAQKGLLSSVVDSAEFLHGGGGLVADDFDDVKHALQTLKVDLSNLGKIMQGVESIKQKAEQDLTNSQSEVSSNFTGTPAPTGGGSATPSAPSAPEEGEKKKSPFDALEEESKGLFGGLFGK